jgi:hypothetical protein
MRRVDFVIVLDLRWTPAEMFSAGVFY